MNFTISSSFFTSELYRLMLYSAIMPSVYLIMMIVGKLRHSFGFSLISVAYKTIASWLLIICIWIFFGFLFAYSMQDIEAFVEAKAGNNPFVRYYPVGVLIIATAGFYYPHANYFNTEGTLFKRALLFLLCFTPLYLMLGYMLLIQESLWKSCLYFGLRSSLLAFVISYPIVFHNKPSSLCQAFGFVLKFLFTPTNRTLQ